MLPVVIKTTIYVQHCKTTDFVVSLNVSKALRIFKAQSLAVAVVHKI